MTLLDEVAYAPAHSDELAYAPAHELAARIRGGISRRSRLSTRSLPASRLRTQA